MLLQEFWTNRFWPYCTRNLRESTCVGYESAWRLHVMPCFGGMDMSAISVELVDKWLAGFDSAGAARKAWSVLRAILRRAIRWNLLDVSVTETIPEGFRPSGDSRALMRGTDNSGAASFYLYGTADGKMVLNGTGYTSRFVGISGCWITE